MSTEVNKTIFQKNTNNKHKNNSQVQPRGRDDNEETYTPFGRQLKKPGYLKDYKTNGVSSLN